MERERGGGGERERGGRERESTLNDFIYMRNETKFTNKTISKGPYRSKLCLRGSMELM